MANKIGIFGGNFDPFHFGHLNSMLTIAEKFELDEIRAVPAFISPLRVQTQGSSPQQRLEMLQLGIRGHEDLIKVDTQEMDRGGVSYTIDTVEAYKDAGIENLHLIIGMDQFLKFDQWKRFDQILENADLIVTSRPGVELPYTMDDWPISVRSLVGDHDRHQAMLKNGHSIHFVQLKDVETSGSEIRRKIRIGQSIQTDVPPQVAEYIRGNKLFESVENRIGDFKKFTDYCALNLNDKGGISVQSYDLSKANAPTEFTLIASGTSTRHTTALAEHLVKEVKKDYGVWPESMEGQSEGRWVVVDYGALIVHIFYDFVRQEYRLEDLWTKIQK